MKNNRTSGSKSFIAKLILPFVFLFALLAVISVGVFPTIRNIKNTQNEIVDLKVDIEDQKALIPIYLPLKESMEDSLPEGIVVSEVVPIDSDDIEDVLDCTLLAMDKISDGTAINIGRGELTTFRQIIEIFTKLSNYNPPIKCLLDKPVGVFSRYCSIDYAKEHLDWEPKISLEAGLRRVYDAVAKKELK